MVSEQRVILLKYMSCSVKKTAEQEVEELGSPEGGLAFQVPLDDPAARTAPLNLHQVDTQLLRHAPGDG